MMAFIQKISMSFLLVSIIVLSISCNSICEFDVTDSSGFAYRFDVTPCHETSTPKSETDCEWDSGSLNLSYKEKFSHSFATLFILSYYQSFIDFVLNSNVRTAFLTGRRQLAFAFDSDSIFIINTIRILI